MKKLTLVYIISFVLLSIFNGHKERSLSKIHRPSVDISEGLMKKKIFLEKNFKHKSLAFLGIGLLLGDKKKISNKMISMHKKLNLLHLMTPSGIHLTSLYVMSGLFLVSLCYQIPLLLIMLIIIISIPGFYSLKRIILYRFLFLLSKRYFPEISSFQVLIFVFVIDFIFGSFKIAPHSFILSFLFLGVIHSTPNKTFCFISLLGGQLLVSFFYHQLINPVGYLIGFGITSIFTILFPFILLSFIFSYNAILESILSFYYQMILWGNLMAPDKFYLAVDNVIIIIVSITFFSIFIYHLNYRQKIILSLILLLISSDLSNFSLQQIWPHYSNLKYQKAVSFPEAIFLKKATMTRDKVKLYFIDNKVCTFKINNFGSEIFCRFYNSFK